MTRAKAYQKRRTKARQRRRLWCPLLPQEQDAPQARDFRFPKAFLMLLYQGVGLGQCLKTVFCVAQVGRSLSRSNNVTSWCGSMDFPCVLQASHEGDSALFIDGDSQELAALPERPVARVAVACDAQHAAPLNTRSGA